MKETTANIKLMACDSRKITTQDLLNMNLPSEMDLIYIDGGHSVETVMADWQTARKLMMGDNTAVVFDDYFPEMPFVGCKVVVDGIDRTVYDVKIHPTVDDYTHPWGRLRTQLALVTKRSKATPGQVPGAAPTYKNEWAADIVHKVTGR
jgi:hypothetical protein